jgi:hypothetical protein
MTIRDPSVHSPFTTLRNLSRAGFGCRCQRDDIAQSNLNCARLTLSRIVNPVRPQAIAGDAIRIGILKRYWGFLFLSFLSLASAICWVSNSRWSVTLVSTSSIASDNTNSYCLVSSVLARAESFRARSLA